MELWDVYTKDREKTGKTMERGAAFEEGAYHNVVHICVFGSDGRMLIQQRQPFKEGWPNMWDLSVGGSALAGEDPQAAAARELNEELGMKYDFTGIRPRLTVNFTHGFDDYFLITEDVDPATLHLQYEEVQDARWATREEILQMIRDRTFIPYYPSLIELLFDARFKYGATQKTEG